MKLYAISDLHLANAVNRRALEAIEPHPDDWLILGGDVGETAAHLELALSVLGRRFRRLVWVPGNHDLWTLRLEPGGLRGEAKYRRLVEICRRHGALTPEDPYTLFPDPAGDGPGFLIAPLFLLYDYTFRPRHVTSAEAAVDWAEEAGIVCSDEILLHADPHPSRQAWCEARVRATERRLEQATRGGVRTVLVNHFPLREDLVRLPFIPRFRIWCGTRATEDWHLRFNAAAVVYGHLHTKTVDYRDGVRFEEVSLGYPRQWNHARGAGSYLRQILPAPSVPKAARGEGSENRRVSDTLTLDR